ncbi:MAG TPA: HAD domain-containing protein [Noviherbaspirillum sp.]
MVGIVDNQIPRLYACYLDFDGVLHDEDVRLDAGRRIILATPGRRLFEWQEILVDLLACHPHVKIVLSTSWVRARSFSYAKRQLDPRLQGRVIGATFHRRFMDLRDFVALPRGMQIWGDVLRRNPWDWFGVDDDGFGWPAWCRDKLVLTDEKLGLSDPAVQGDIRRRLQMWSGMPTS